MSTLVVVDRSGPEEFEKTLALQEELLAARIAGTEKDDLLILVEHAPVYTVGRGVEFQKPASVPARDVPWIEVKRGGEGTFHGPGQLVAYPIFSLDTHGRDVHRFLRRLEKVVISVLQTYQLEGFQRPGLTGVWVRDSHNEPKKIASLGVGVRRWVTYHGLSFNVDSDLSYFQAISPCGQAGEVITSLAEQLTMSDRKVPRLPEVKEAFVEAFQKEFLFTENFRRRPNWLKAKAPGSPEFVETNDIVRKLKLVTVCEEAHCPNIGECWSHHTATFMILGDLCTRRCSFCAVKDGALENLSPLDPLEPFRVGKAVAELKLEHVVITSVNRDDLEDMGAAHFDLTVRQISKQNPNCAVELLIPDMRGKRELVQSILQSGFVKVLNHNVETVPRLYKTVRPGAKFERSLDILRWAKEMWPNLKTKSGLMVGLGETRAEVIEVMEKLRESGVDIVTIGQYLRPTEKQLSVQRYISPEEFREYEQAGQKLGFSFVESGPLVRSSYHAWKHSHDDLSVRTSISAF